MITWTVRIRSPTRVRGSSSLASRCSARGPRTSWRCSWLRSLATRASILTEQVPTTISTEHSQIVVHRALHGAMRSAKVSPPQSKTMRRGRDNGLLHLVTLPRSVVQAVRNPATRTASTEW